MPQETIGSLAYSKAENLTLEIASRGLAVLAPESLGVPADLHQRIYEKEQNAIRGQQRITPELIPEILDILNAPGLVDACDRIVGKNWAVVPFIHNAPFTSGAFDQHWHKDDNAPYNARKQRHHQAVQLEILYYPQEVTAEMGPTMVVPFSHYWTFNHEENHDNFAGADHIDFAYLIEGLEKVPVNGPDSKYDSEDILHRRTHHDHRMSDAVSNLKWPLVTSFEVAPIHAGTVLMYSHNTFHRANHRRDDWRQWQGNPRFMWRFWIYRTNEPDGQPTEAIDWNQLERDPLTNIQFSEVNSTTQSVWNYHKYWMETGKSPKPKLTKASASKLRLIAEDLIDKILAKGDENEPNRIGAAYQLAALEDVTLAKEFLRKALLYDRENVRRAATYGLIALGEEATEIFQEAVRSPIKWVRKAGVFGLGEVGLLNEEVLYQIKSCLLNDSSTYIRSVAAGAIGSLVRRAVASKHGQQWISDCVHALVQSLNNEPNRLSMDLAQRRDIKFVRPTDDCDVCEGMGVDFGLERFKPERSAVRENTLWTLVIICSHGQALIGDALESLIQALKTVIFEDTNVISVGYGMDALSRLIYLQRDKVLKTVAIKQLEDEFKEILLLSPLRCWESLSRVGLKPESL